MAIFIAQLHFYTVLHHLTRDSYFAVLQNRFHLFFLLCCFTKTRKNTAWPLYASARQTKPTVKIQRLGLFSVIQVTVVLVFQLKANRHLAAPSPVFKELQEVQITKGSGSFCGGVVWLCLR